ncbi:DUF2505 domain-containing protein [Nocardioides panacisoli]|uniref:DUF2505 domain-containing protein n=1 Tax=Nocardioides panacisoli TaxID=627624 RepID=UPI001C62C45B|nr:DUF2505 domain-containing protein [Nocardioides panacisoli]QYJ02430.1 DUF2505 domain-containing protein [Nocardioides panacisoli]
MATRLVHEMVYDAPAEKVAAMLADPAFRESVCETQGATEHAVQVTPAGEGMSVTIDQWLPTEGVPSFAKKIVGDSTNVVQREEWSGPLHGDIEVTIPGKPGTMVGTATLRESDGVTTETVELEIKVKIPVIAGKLEELVAKLLGSALRAEERAGKKYLD